MFWSAGYKQRIDYTNIIRERAIICICWKWAGRKKVYSLTWDEFQSDKTMLEQFIKVVNEADEIIGHNGDKFDLPWLRTRCIKHDVAMFPTYKTLDTLKQARGKFRFNSNRLDYIAKFLGFEGKIKTEFSLWKDILILNCSKAMGKMVTYCKEDVRQLERVFDKMKNHIQPRVHHGVLAGEKRDSCPDCGSYELKVVKVRATALGNKRYQHQCECGKYHTMAKPVEC